MSTQNPSNTNTQHAIKCTIEVFNYNKAADLDDTLDTSNPPCQLKLTCEYEGDSPSGITDWQIRLDTDPFNTHGYAFLKSHGGNKYNIESTRDEASVANYNYARLGWPLFGTGGGAFGNDPPLDPWGNATTEDVIALATTSSVDGSSQIKRITNTATQAVFHITLNGELGDIASTLAAVGVPNPDFNPTTMPYTQEFFAWLGGPVVVYAKREDSLDWEERSIWLACREHKITYARNYGTGDDVLQTTQDWDCPDWMYQTGPRINCGPYTDGGLPDDTGYKIRVKFDACATVDTATNTWTWKTSNSLVDRNYPCCEDLPSGLANEYFGPCGVARSCYSMKSGPPTLSQSNIDAGMYGWSGGGTAEPFLVMRYPSNVNDVGAAWVGTKGDTNRHIEFDMYFGTVPQVLLDRDFDTDITLAYLTTEGIEADGEANLVVHEMYADCQFPGTAIYGIGGFAQRFPVAFLAVPGLDFAPDTKVPVNVKLATTIDGCEDRCCFREPDPGCNNCGDLGFLGSPYPNPPTIKRFVLGSIVYDSSIHTAADIMQPEEYIQKAPFFWAPGGVRTYTPPGETSAVSVKRRFASMDLTVEFNALPQPSQTWYWDNLHTWVDGDSLKENIDKEKSLSVVVGLSTGTNFQAGLAAGLWWTDLPGGGAGSVPSDAPDDGSYGYGSTWGAIPRYTPSILDHMKSVSFTAADLANPLVPATATVGCDDITLDANTHHFIKAGPSISVPMLTESSYRNFVHVFGQPDTCDVTPHTMTLETDFVLSMNGEARVGNYSFPFYKYDDTLPTVFGADGTVTNDPNIAKAERAFCIAMPSVALTCRYYAVIGGQRTNLLFEHTLSVNKVIKRVDGGELPPGPFVVADGLDCRKHHPIPYDLSVTGAIVPQYFSGTGLTTTEYNYSVFNPVDNLTPHRLTATAPKMEVEVDIGDFLRYRMIDPDQPFHNGYPRSNRTIPDFTADATYGLVYEDID